jgi:hypothetical protein
MARQIRKPAHLHMVATALGKIDPAAQAEVWVYWRFYFTLSFVEDLLWEANRLLESIIYDDQ